MCWADASRPASFSNSESPNRPYEWSKPCAACVNRSSQSGWIGPRNPLSPRIRRPRKPGVVIFPTIDPRLHRPAPALYARISPPARITGRGSGCQSRRSGTCRGPDIRRAFPNLGVHVESVHRDPRRALVDASTTATLTVVGGRGRGRISEVMHGSVALYVASHAHSPVAVSPPAANIRATAPAGPILLGVDGSIDSDAAVAFAFDEAAGPGNQAAGSAGLG